jgi:hypothetical protein
MHTKFQKNGAEYIRARNGAIAAEGDQYGIKGWN